MMMTAVGVADYLGVSADRLRCHAYIRQLIAEENALSQQMGNRWNFSQVTLEFTLSFTPIVGVIHLHNCLYSVQGEWKRR